MSRITYVAPDESTAWFDLDRAALIAEDVTKWDGQNHCSLATGSQWTREGLYRTAGGVHIVRRDNRDGRHGGFVGVSWYHVSDPDAEDWLRRQGLHGEADEHFAASESERGPGRPEIGGRISTALGDELLGRVDAVATAAGLTRAEWLRRTVGAAL